MLVRYVQSDVVSGAKLKAARPLKSLTGNDDLGAESLRQTRRFDDRRRPDRFVVREHGRRLKDYTCCNGYNDDRSLASMLACNQMISMNSQCLMIVTETPKCSAPFQHEHNRNRNCAGCSQNRDEQMSSAIMMRPGRPRSRRILIRSPQFPTSYFRLTTFFWVFVGIHKLTPSGSLLVALCERSLVWKMRLDFDRWHDIRSDR